MPTYKIKDLILSVEHPDKEILTIKYCRKPSVIECLCTHKGSIPKDFTVVITRLTTGCGCTGTGDPIYRQKFDVVDLAQAKQEIEELQLQIESQLTPQTLEDYNLLESKLGDVMTEIRIQKANFTKVK